MPSDSRTREIAGNLGIILASAGVCLVAVQWLYGTAGILSLMKPVTGVDWFGTEWVLAVVAYGLLAVMPLVAIAPSLVVGVVTNRASRWFDDDEPWLRRSLILAAALVAAGLLLAVGLRVLCFLDATR